jgi:hypothetical protein
MITCRGYEKIHPAFFTDIYLGAYEENVNFGIAIRKGSMVKMLLQAHYRGQCS